MEYVFLSILILFAGAVFSLIIKKEWTLRICSVFSLIALATAIYPATRVIYNGIPLEFTIKMSPIFGSLTMVLDALSAFFVLVISVVGLFGVVYANGYLKPYIEKKDNIASHGFFFMVLLASMLAVTVIQHGLVFLIAWEMMSLSSFFLVIFEAENKEVLKSGIKYLVYMHFSVLFLIIMFAILSNVSGSFEFSQYAKALSFDPNLANVIFILAFIGFGIKAGFVPFHNWLPDAHPAAPTHVSAVMSAVMIKTGIYGILRILLMVGVPSKALVYFVLFVSVITALYGILYAVTQQDTKRILAYSSIENVGIIGIGLSIGMLGLVYANPMVAVLGFCGGLFHLLNHSFFKELLFFAVGNTYIKTHTRNIEHLGGLAKRMPYTAFFFIFASVAICALPPLNGFVSEFLIYVGILLGLPKSGIAVFLVLILTLAALAFVGTMAILGFSKAAGMIFLGEPRSDLVTKADKDVDFVMLLPMWVLVGLMLLISVVPHHVITGVFCPVSLFVKTDSIYDIMRDLIVIMRNISVVFVVLYSMIAVIFLLKKVLGKNSKEYTTWGCGYNKANPHMQYTASSYVNPFIAMLKPLFKRVSHIKKPKELFPKDAYYELEFEDIEEAYIVRPIVKLDEKFLTKFERIQNGNIQQYILFGLIFLLLSIVGLILIG